MKGLVAGGLAAGMLLFVTACAALNQDTAQDTQAVSRVETEKERMETT